MLGIVKKSRNMDNDNDISQTVTMADNKTVLQALALINDCNKYKMEFVQTNKEKLTTMSTKEEDNDKESKEPDYDEDKEQLEEEQEKETGEKTTNTIF
jgi:hypothetical protein